MKIRFLSDKPRTAFFIVYSLLYVLAVQAAGYVLPFILSMIFAVALKPLYDYLLRRFRFRSSFAATSLTLLIFASLLGMIAFLMFLVVRQAIGLLGKYGNVISDYLRSPELFDQLREGLLSGDLWSAASFAASALFQAIPLVITFVMITFALTVFFLHHLTDIRSRLVKRAGEYGCVLQRVFSVGYAMIRSFLRSYSILYLITFAEAALIFFVTGAEYPLAFAFVTAVADIIPVLGPGVVYIPIGIVMILQKNYIGGWIIIGWFLLTAVLRQVMEPRLVSRSIKIHPLIALSAIYFSVVTMNLWVLFYVVSLFMLYRVLNTAGVFEKTL